MSGNTEAGSNDERLNEIMATLQQLSARVDSMGSARQTPANTGVPGHPAPTIEIVSSPRGLLTPQVVSEMRKLIHEPDRVPDRAVDHEFSENEESLKSSNTALPIFSGTDYTDWYDQHRVFFIRTGLMRFLSEEETPPDQDSEPEKHREWTQKNLRGLQILMRTVSS